MDSENISATARTRFQDVILAFFEAQGRDLPWRHTTDPYKILVSELMLQQTQVPRVIPKYEAFLDRFPTPRVLAAAPLAEVLQAWQGLGYNRRAKYLWEFAKVLQSNPRPSFDDLLAAKGIGEYTAAAVCAFAYNQDVAAIDVNVRRVFARFFGPVDDSFIRELVPAGRSRDWHNALMDFGSVTCKKRGPLCQECPLRKACYAVAHDTFDTELPAVQPKFPGSVRWHRGQILKHILAKDRTRGQLWGLLDERHRDREKFHEAIKGLHEEELVAFSGELLIKP